MQIWEDLAMDFITRLPLSNGFTVILVVINRLSKYAHFFTMKTDYTSKQVAEILIKNVVKLHGFTKTIVSDRDKVFTSEFWQHLFKLSGTTINLTTAYHPQSVVNQRLLTNALKCTLDASLMILLRIGLNYYLGQNFGTTLTITTAVV